VPPWEMSPRTGLELLARCKIVGTPGTGDPQEHGLDEAGISVRAELLAEDLDAERADLAVLRGSRARPVRVVWVRTVQWCPLVSTNGTSANTEQ
jgi:hypothetical protein